MITAKVSAVKLCGVAAVAVALLCVAAAEAEAPPNNLLPGAKPIVIYPGIGRYSIHEELLTWAEAHKTCLLENGHLAIIDSEEEAAIILEIMDTNKKTDIHIGLYDSFAEGKFVSVRGQALEKLGYHTWSEGYPMGGTTNNHCAFRNAGGIGGIGTGFHDVSNTTQYPFICELPMWDDYDLIPGLGYYKLHNEWRLWQESWETCRSEGGYLLVFTSIIERDLVVDKFEGTVSNTAIWYGAHHVFTDHLFITIFDELLDKSGFSTWINEYPGALPNTEYPFVALYMVPGGVHDLFPMTRTYQLPFICKHDLHDRT